MQTIQEINSELVEYAKSKNLTGLPIEKLCSLLSHSIYRNQMLQTQLALESSFVTSTTLSSRIHHASNLLYSVPRGRCPLLSFTDVIAMLKQDVKYLQECATFNGYHLFYAHDKSYTPSNVSEVSLLCSSGSAGEVEVDLTDSSYFAIFNMVENVSSDYVLYLGDKRVPPEEVTEDPNVFYYKTFKDSKAEYKYKYLVVTIPGYGVKVSRRANTSTWEGPKMKLRYIPYSEVVPDMSMLRSLPGFMFVSDSNTYTKVQVTPFEGRMDDLDEIYNNAVSSYQAQSTLSTTGDLISYLKTVDPNSVFRVYPNTVITGSTGNYTVNHNTMTSTVVHSGALTNEEVNVRINQWKQSVNVALTISAFKAEALETSPKIVYVVANSNYKTLTNTDLSNLTYEFSKMIGEKIDHSDFEARIIKLGYDRVKVYNESACTTESTFKCDCKVYEYPKIVAYVGGTT